ncbi:cold shock domain-containing protein E1-like [Oscarella lobularis]|uniref:cold shock domain-containing protein E1-like n=1 Tax=Oscarella lobularis TaxID=121494 RepID=UPI0033131B1C
MAFYSKSDSHSIVRRKPTAHLAKNPLNRLAYQTQLGVEDSKVHNEKEQGIIEKLCGSYGFIESCERVVRLFFHFSQYRGEPETLDVGDPVEFVEVVDRKAKKPTAIRVNSIEAKDLAFELIGDTKVTGRVDSLPRRTSSLSSSSPSSKGGKFSLLDRLYPNRWNPDEGRITCEYKGECFFLSFGIGDLIDKSVDLMTGDEVSLSVSTHKRTGIVRAISVSLEKRKKEEKVEGIIASLKDSFGFIERADEVGEIFFHRTECGEGFDLLRVSDEVVFIVQNRHGKTVATQIKKLPPGTVQIDDISQRLYYGKIQEIDDSTRPEREARNSHFGTVNEDGAGWDASYVFYKRDLATSCTLLPGDSVTFRLATDKRNGQDRATEVALRDFVDEDEREQGIVHSIKDGFGFIGCATRDTTLFFHFCEVVDSQEISRGNEVEYTPLLASQKERAVRVKILPKGTVQFEIKSEERYEGVVTNWRQGGSTSSARGGSAGGEIEVVLNDDVDVLKFTDEDMTDIRTQIEIGDKVSFNVFTSRRNESRKRAGDVTKLFVPKDVSLHRGYVTVLKDHFGFIELERHNGEVFFNYGACVCDSSELFFGCEVEFSIVQKGGKRYADNVTPLGKGILDKPILEPTVHEGIVIKQLRDVHSNKPYVGIIETGDGEEVDFGVSSVVDSKTYLQLNDKVTFQIGTCSLTRTRRAYNVVRKLERHQGKVDMYHTSRQFGFIACPEFENLFFHANELRGGEKEIRVGDVVEFSIGYGVKAKRECAIELKIVERSSSPRKMMQTGRSAEKKKFMAAEARLRAAVIRQPNGPDGTKGFTLKRSVDAET